VFGARRPAVEPVCFAAMIVGAFPDSQQLKL
jgi:hypothetical protein